jgi:hypothetical protein
MAQDNQDKEIQPSNLQLMEESPLATKQDEVAVEAPAEGEEELDIDDIVGSLDSGEEEGEKPPVDTKPDFEKPEFAELSNQFEELMGVDLKTAYEHFTKSAEHIQTLTAKLQEMESQRTLQELQDTWDVTPKELDRRVNAVLKVFDKMKPAQVEKYNNLEGVQKIWESIESKKGGTQVAPSSGGQKPVTPVKRYKQSEIRDMMLNNPTLYDQNQAALSEAFRLGLVDSD